jgi:hypothetical protein
MSEIKKEILWYSLAEDYRNAGRKNLFPTKASLDWFIRKHRQKLIKVKAIVCPTGRRLISPESFDEFIARLTAEGVENE